MECVILLKINSYHHPLAEGDSFLIALESLEVK